MNYFKEALGFSVDFPTSSGSTMCLPAWACKNLESLLVPTQAPLGTLHRLPLLPDAKQPPVYSSALWSRGGGAYNQERNLLKCAVEQAA